MPLVTICGLPGSGKSKRAAELAEILRKRIKQASQEGSVTTLRNVEVIDDDRLGIPRTAYAERDSEKAARSKQMSAVKRLLDKNTVVILDNMSYIKGFRYQLFCEARALATPSLVLYVGTPRDQCIADAWGQELWDALAFRFEEPNGMTRWDAPLFVILPEDKLPTDELWQSLTTQKPIKTTTATKTREAAPQDYLKMLNDETAAVVRLVLDLHRDAPGAEVHIDDQPLQLPLNLGMANLNRIRRTFVAFNKSANLAPDRIRPFFVDFLAQSLEQ